MSSLRAKIIRSITSAYLRRQDAARLDVQKVRRRFDALSRLMPIASGTRMQRDEIGGLQAEWLTPTVRRDDKLLLYLHGGGYVVGGCAMHRQFVSYIARTGKLQALLPEYRLSPEHKFPAAVDDAVAVYKAVLQRGTKARDIIVAGDSAGGGLSMALLLALRDAGDPLPAAAILMSPFLDVTGSGESMTTRKTEDPWFRPADLSIIADYYCAPHQHRDPLVSPVFADVAGLPPIYIQVGNDEILLSDSERIAAKIAAAGGNVELDVWPEMWHVFQMFVGKMPEAGRAIDKIGRYIGARFP